MEIDSLPVELDEVERRVMQLEIERQALRKETDAGSRDRLVKLEKELADLKEEGQRLRAQWQDEKGSLNRGQTLRQELEQLRAELEQAQRQSDYARASELMYGQIPAIERQLKQVESGQPDTPQSTTSQSDALGPQPSSPKMLKEEVDEEDIAEVVSRWTGVPVSRMMEGEVQKLIQMESRLRMRVVGQDEAIHAVANTVRRASAGLKDPNRPLGSFIFLGPTGVGKTELARALAEFLFDDEAAMIRLDMS